MVIIWMLKITGLSLLCLALLHAFFPKRFHWKEELAQLSLLNREIFYVHCTFIVIVLILMGLLSFFYATELLQATSVNRAILGGLTVFWGFRLFAQWFIYSPELWRGHRFNTAMHVLFTFVWGFYTLTYALAWLQIN